MVLPIPGQGVEQYKAGVVECTTIPRTHQLLYSGTIHRETMFPLFSAFAFAQATLATPPRHAIDISVKDATASRAVNIYLRYLEAVPTSHNFTYGDCKSPDFLDAHHTIATVPFTEPTDNETRLVWVVPEDIHPGGCILAWSENKALIGRSKPLALDKLLDTMITKRDRIPMTNDSGIDAEGPWFNGVSLLKNKEIGPVDVEKVKNKCESIPLAFQ